MTCHCRAEFCFVCGVRWKNCECPQWNEQRLIDTARMRADHDIGVRARVAQPVRYEAAVARMAENIRVNHGCVWHSWRGTGPGNCEECGDYLPVFLKVRFSSLGVWFWRLVVDIYCPPPSLDVP
jgi:hypothetical protein